MFWICYSVVSHLFKFKGDYSNFFSGVPIFRILSVVVSWPVKIWSSASALPLYRACENLKFRFRTSALPGLWKAEDPFLHFRSTWPVKISEVPLPHFRSTLPVKILSSASTIPLLGQWKSEVPLSHFRSTWPMKIWSSASARPLYLACEVLKFRFALPLYLAYENLTFRFRTFALHGLWRSLKFRFRTSAQPGPWNLKFQFRSSALLGLWKSEIPIPHFCLGLWRSEVSLTHFRSTRPVKI